MSILEDTLQQTLDTIPDSPLLDSMSVDSTKIDSTVLNPIEKAPVKVADEGLQKPMLYGARDTQWYEHKDKLMHLYGDAFVDYDGMKLKAGYIKLNIEKNIAEAMFIEDPSGRKTQRPTFFDGNKEIVYNHLKYNFKTKKGIVYDVISTEGDLYLHGATTKFVGGQDENDTKDDVIYNKNTLITSCNHEHPHYGFRARKLKLIPEKIAVLGPANLELGGVPTPFWIPYGFFPLVSGKSTGFIFPQDYEYSPTLGFGMRGVGWYFPINDNVDLTATGTIYTRGTNGLKLHSNFKKRYKYSGHVTLGYNDQRTEIAETGRINSMKSFSINLRHDQDRKAHPYRKIGGVINMETENYGRTVYSDAEIVTENTYYSNFDFSHSLPNSPWRFQLGLRHDQNTRNRSLNITLPNVSFLMDRIFPFKSKNSSSSKERWYEKFSYKYDVKLKNLIETTDTTLWTQETLDNMKSGVSHEMETSATFKMFKYFTLTTRADYDEIWMLQEINNTEERESVLNYIDIDPITGDSIRFFRDSLYIQENTLRNFNAFRSYSASADVNTQFFSTAVFSKGWLRGIRHTVKPSIGIEFSPDTETKYMEMLETDVEDRRVEDGVYNYSRFPTQPFRPRLQKERNSINYGMTHLLELKYFSKKDSTEKKIKLFDRITMGGNYNYVPDSLNWSIMRIKADTRLFKGMTTINIDIDFDPYMEDGNKRIAKTVRSETGKFLRRDYFRFKLSNQLSFKKLSDLFSKKKSSSSAGDDASGARTQQGGSKSKSKGFKDPSMISWLDKINVSHDFVYEINTIDNIDTSGVSTHSLSLNGSINLTDNWTFTIGRVGYNLIRKRLTYPTFRMNRKLHCWNMNFSWSPTVDTYSFFIGVSSSSLNFIKYNYGQNQFDGLGSRAAGYF